MNRLFKPAAALLLVFTTGLVAFGQGGSTGSLAGTVADQKGDVVAGASVLVRSESTGSEVTTTTADNGTFNVPALPSGLYRVTVAVRGFKKAIMQNVKIDVSQPSSITVLLEVGAPEETVTVVGEGGELLQTQTATVGTTITGRQITELPFTSRDALDLVTLLPGTNTVGRPRQSSVNGLPKGALSITIDGTDAQDNLLKSSDGFFTYIRPRIDAIQEVTISTATPGAESSGDGAVVIKFITRGGTNDYTGSLYWYHRNPSLNANYWFNNTLLPEDPVDRKAPRTRILLNQYGGRFGGPITIPGLFNGKDRAFFFVNYEEYRLPERFSRTRTVFLPHALTGEYRYITSTGVRSVNLLQIAQAAGLPSTADPTVLGLLNQVQSSTAEGGLQPITNDPNRSSLTFINPGGQDRYFPTVRFDVNLTKNHHFENIWNYQVFNNGVDFLNTADPAFPGFPNVGGQDSNRWSNTTALRSTLTPTIVNEARFGLTGGISLFRAQMGPDQFSNQGGFALGITAAGISNAFNAAHNSNQRRNSPTQEFSDTLTWVKDEHTFTFGGSYKRINLFQQELPQLVPTIAFGVDATDTAGQAAFNNNAAAFPGSTAAQRATAASFYAVLTGRVTSIGRNAFLSEGENQTYTLLGERLRRARQEEFGLFMQDSWRFRPNLTLNYGLRWQPQGAFTVKSNTFAIPAAFEDVFGLSGPGNLFRPGVIEGRAPSFVQAPEEFTPYEADRNNFGPSVGFAWSPDWKSGALKRLFGAGGQSVIRGGYSIAFVREGTQTFLSVTGANPGGTIAATRSIALGTLPVGTLLRNPAGLAPPSVPSSATFPLAGASTDGVNVFDPNLKTGYVQSWTFGIQRELTKNMVVEARYVGNRGIKLWRQYDLNEINVVENGFTEEFRRAQANLIANNASGVTARRNSFAYFGPNTGTQPLPVLLGFIRGPGAAGTFNPNNQALYTNALFTNTTLLTNLSPIAPNVLNFAFNVYNNAARRANAIGTGVPANYFVVNPTTLGGGTVTNAGTTYTTGGAFIVDNGGQSWYDALVLEFRRRMSRGVLVQASYAWSKSQTTLYDVSSSVFSQYASLRDPRLAKTASPFDTRHALKLNWMAELPVGRGKMFFGDSGGLVNHLVGGWEIHGTARLQSGAVFNFGNVQLVGMTREELQKNIDVRKQGSGIVTYLPDDIIQNTVAAFNVDPTNSTGFSAQFGVPAGRFIAPASFGGCVQQYIGQCGNSNLTLYGPRFLKIDASIIKKFHFTERVNFEMRGEFLNAINNQPFRVGGWAADSVTVTNFAATTFGQLGNGTAYQDTSTTNDPGGRLVQLVLRLNF